MNTSPLYVDIDTDGVVTASFTKGYYAHIHRDDEPGHLHTHGSHSHIYRHSHPDGCAPHEHTDALVAGERS